MLSSMWSINLTCSPLEVLEYLDEEYQEDLREHGDDLDDADFRVFKSEREAYAFKSLYEKTLRTLPKLSRRPSMETNGMLLKRRYLVQTRMKLKNQTYRNYRKDWKRGDVILFHDQTYYTLARLERIVEDEAGLWRYDFTPID